MNLFSSISFSQSLQTEYDKAVDELEAEKKLNRELQKKVTQTVDQVAEMELKSSQLEDDKRQLLVKVIHFLGQYTFITELIVRFTTHNSELIDDLKTSQTSLQTCRSNRQNKA